MREAMPSSITFQKLGGSLICGKRRMNLFSRLVLRKKDPEHVRVAKMLNEMDPKNQFIVNAVLCYVDSGYVNVRPWNLQPLFVQAENIQPSVQIKQGPKPLKEDEELDENDARTIMQSLKNFRA